MEAGRALHSHDVMCAKRVDRFGALLRAISQSPCSIMRAGSDLAYYEEDAEALVQTVLERTLPGGMFVSFLPTCA